MTTRQASRGRRAIAAGAALLLAGCGGGGGGSGGDAGRTPPASAPPTAPDRSRTTIGTVDPFLTASAAALAGVVRFDESAAAIVRATPEFATQDVRIDLDGARVSSFAPRDVRAEYPLSAGLTGAGETIAIMDDGFRQSHVELAGKTVRTYGTLSSRDHGTAVAAVAAGVRDGTGIMGIAPGAALHLSSFTGGFASRAAATRDAIVAVDAVVQNNSWGFVDAQGKPVPVTAVQNRLAADPAGGVAGALQATLGGTRAEIQSYLDALHAFTARGVVVFSAPNDASVTSLSVMDGLPLVAPELAPGWLVAVNAVPVFRDDAIVSARRLSAACLQLAHSCLAANGVVRSATAQSDTAMGLWSGTSFAAPQISAGVALLAEAFPSLPPSDLRRRLLASADNRFFAHTGVTDFGNGVVHGFGEEFGHGFMNLKAALLPIGAVGLPRTQSAYGGVEPLGSGLIASAGPQGDALATALAVERISVFDALGADFGVSAGILHARRATTTATARLERFARANATGSEVASVSFTSGDGGEGSAGATLHAGPAEAVLDALGLNVAASPVSASAGTLVGLAENATSLAIERPLGAGRTLSLYGFTTASAERTEPPGAVGYVRRDVADPDGAERMSSGAGFAVSQPGPGATRLSVGGVFLGEAGAALGMTGSGRLGTLAGSSAALDVAWSAPLGSERVRLRASAQIGLGSAKGDGLVAGASGAWFGAFGIALETAAALRPGDRFTVFARQPLRMEAGRLALDVPSGRTPDGAIAWRRLDLDLAPSARQIDLGFDYATDLGASDRLRLAAAYAHDDGHVAGARGFSLLGAYQRRF